MIKPIRAWQDSQGNLHATRGDACKAEFRRHLIAAFFAEQHHANVTDDSAITVGNLVDGMFELDRIFGEATREDTRVEFADGVGK